MKFSIITVCFNSEETIRQTIESVQAQDYLNIEYIIIDGCSSDATISIIQEYAGCIDTIVSEADKGIYDAMNKGLQLATGDVVGILNSDDFYENSNVISDVANQFKHSSSVDMVFGNIILVESNNTNKIVRFYDSRKFNAWKLRFGWMPPHTATFIKKSAYELVGVYSLSFKISADYELFVRMLMVHRLTYVQLDKVLVRMRMGGVSTLGIKNSLILNSEIVEACKKNGIYTNLLFVLLKIPFKYLELLKKPMGVS